MLRILETLILLAALLLLPWVVRRHYRFLLQKPAGLAFLAGLGLILLVPLLGGAAPSTLQVLSTLLLCVLGMPLLRTRTGVGVLVFLCLGLTLALYLLPFVVFKLERAVPTDEVWMTIFQTNMREATEYLHDRPWLMALFLVPAGLLLLYGTSRTLRPGRPRRRLLLLLLLLVLVNFNTGPGRELLSVYGDYRSQIAHWKALAQERSRGLEACPFTAEPPPEERKMLVVVGESTTRRHMALFGYGRPTTPSLQALQKEGGLYAFDDVISPHCLTMRSLEKVLTTSSNEHPLPFGESISLLDVARKAGFRTTWVSNQDRMGEWDDQVSVLASSADRVQFTSGRTGNNQKAEPDGILLPLLEHLLPTEPGNALVVCHLMGTHREYSHRYPEDYAPPGLGHGDRVEQYDVAIHYGDQFLTQVIRKAQVAGFDTVIYFSDHGEAPEELGYGGHNPNIYRPEMVEIPFLVWLSPRYRQRHPALVRRLQRALHRPAMTDSFLHTFLDLAGIRSSVFDPTRSWINAHFLERPRRVINNTIPYP